MGEWRISKAYLTVTEDRYIVQEWYDMELIIMFYLTIHP